MFRVTLSLYQDTINSTTTWAFIFTKLRGKVTMGQIDQSSIRGCSARFGVRIKPVTLEQFLTWTFSVRWVAGMP